LPDAEERRQPRWPLRLALSLVIVVDAFLVVMLTAERNAGNIPTLVSSVGLVVFCILAWRGIRWSRWLLIAFLAWRVTALGISSVSRFGAGDYRTLGSLTLYVVAVVLVASPLGCPRTRAT